ncbi:MAG: DUF3857 domain-containing protein [Bacteroidetes bacterium]|jgi:hypothetical protein|nr:DUF3857 domain-containing protein [Bacteroidota bacterium]
MFSRNCFGRHFLGSLIASTLFIGSFVASNAYAQPIKPEPAEWGDVSPDALQRTKHPADSNATAIILSDIGESRLRRNNTWGYERERRVQVLSESAFDTYGTHEIYVREDVERVKDIEARTYVIENGEVKRYELDEDDIFEEEIRDGLEKVSFTLPNLEPGAMIEYRYEIRSDPAFLQAWQFQGTEPTVFSKYTVKIPEFLKYAVLARGSAPFSEQDRKRTYSNLSNEIGATEYMWEMHNAPAIRAEEFMTTPDDYIRSIEFQLKAIVNPITSERREIMTSWEDLAVDLMGTFSFGRELGRHHEVRDLTDATVEGLSTADERVSAIYDLVQNRISWNDRQTFLLGRSLDEVLESGTGTSAEINMLLCSMLQEADIDAYPVLISTRGHGMMSPTFPFTRQFNEVIVAVKVEDSYTFLDATSPHRPLGMLPPRALNGQGWLVDTKSPTWLRIPPTGAESRNTLIRASLSPDGTVSGLLNITDESYSGVRSRDRIAESSVEAFVREDMFASEVSLSSTRVTNETALDQPLEIQSSFSLPAHAQASGDFIYVKPVIADAVRENPLQAPDRSFPVDLAYPRQNTYTLSMQIPDGYVVEEMPANRRVRLDGDGGTFLRVTQEAEGSITMRIQMVLRETTFQPDDYDMLRDFFAEYVATHAEPIVLKKAAVAEPSAPSHSADDPTDSSAGDR